MSVVGPLSRELAATSTRHRASSPVVDAAEFRRSVARFATGIVILSCATDDGGIHGMTANSFTSVSLAPPTVLVSLKPGTTSELLGRTGRFGVSVLAESQQAWSAHFSGRPDPALRPEFTVREHLPTLVQCLAWFECELIKAVDVYDHTLYIAHVMACGHQAGDPLVYFGSTYCCAAAIG